MMLQCASVEFSRLNKSAQILAFHPGTVDTPLSEPFQRGVPEGKLFTPEFVAGRFSGAAGKRSYDRTSALPRLGWQAHPILTSTKKLAACSRVLFEHTPQRGRSRSGVTVHNASRLYAVVHGFH